MHAPITVSSLLCAFLAGLVLPSPILAAPIVLDANLHHLRSAERREWSDFPAQAEGSTLTVKFKSSRNAAEHSLRLRQQDVRLAWRISLNGLELGRLLLDENDTVAYLPIPPGRLRDGENTLTIEALGRNPDDIRVGEFHLLDQPVAQVLNEAIVEVSVNEETKGGSYVPVPCRITVQNDQGTLISTSAASNDRLAVRPGVIYSAHGSALFGLPAGDYTISAGRGFEYSVATERVSLRAGANVSKLLTIRREVPTPGYAACDPHIHTLTHSGHGDATAVERVITLAGEGIELPIATEHNKASDYRSLADRAGVRERFTMLVGNEVTTPVGHFNVFPVDPSDPVPDHRCESWKAIAAALGPARSPRVVILNHPRDIHLKFRPFDPAHHIAVTGENLNGWELPANAMEVVNSGAQQSDVLRLVHDWLGMLNRGLRLTPAGTSDSHDVSRFIVGQGRTYVRCKDDRPGAIDAVEAVRAFAAGEVLVSCGLLADISVNDRFGPGQLCSGAGDLRVKLRVLGPAWTKADRVELYANGILILGEDIKDDGRAGVKWESQWVIPRPKHDVHLVAVATGPGVESLYWPIAKPYQAMSPTVRKRILGVTGAVWVDGDGDGTWTNAFEYAQQIVTRNEGNWNLAITELAVHDEAVAAQAAGLLRRKGVSLTDKDVRRRATTSGAAVLRGFDAYAEAWRASQIARP